MTEPDAALTDYALAVECAAFGMLLARERGRGEGLRAWFIVFFASVGTASLCGGTVHGFFLAAASAGQAVLGPATLLAIGVTAFAAWAIGATLLFSRPVGRWVIIAATMQFLLYGAIVLSVSRDFRLAILGFLPAALFQLPAFGAASRRRQERSPPAGASGMALALIASVGQQLRIGIHPLYFNHNALYHVVQAAALFLVFVEGRRLIRAGATPGGANLA
jgi:hypothetical protein